MEIQDRFTQRFGSHEDDVVRWLEERGYHPATYDVEHNALSLTTLDEARLRNNAFFVRRTRLDELRDRLARHA